jgi:hypothetical protein
VSTLLEAPPAPVPSTPASNAVRRAIPHSPEDADLAGNPVAAMRARPERPSADLPRLRLVLIWAVLVPTIVFLVSNPLGWLLLFFAILGVGALTGLGSIL